MTMVQGFRHSGQWRARQFGDRSEGCRPDAADFVMNRVAMQQEHMQTIWLEFGDGVRAIIPLSEKGGPMLNRLCDSIFPGDGLRVLSTEISGESRPALVDS